MGCTADAGPPTTCREGCFNSMGLSVVCRCQHNIAEMIGDTEVGGPVLQLQPPRAGEDRCQAGGERRCLFVLLGHCCPGLLHR